MSEAPPNEVSAYFKRLLICIALGLILMTSTVLIVWNLYGHKLKEGAPLPEDAPRALPAFRN